MEDNARLDAAADRAVALPRRLITMLDMSAHRRTRRLAASTAADYRMFKNAEYERSPLPDRSRSPGARGRAAPGELLFFLLYVTNDFRGRYEVRRKPSLWLLRYLNALS